MSQPMNAPGAEDCDFKWGTKRKLGGKAKNVQFYQSFFYDGDEYSLYDDVYLYKEGEPEPYIGKLVKIWEQKQKKMVKILWFFRPVEILNWLKDEKTLENELLLASGDGPGLADVNPLEAIAGKCSVVCTSKDSRNPQPSPEEVRMADYIFYRTFDVGTCTISDKIGDNVVGVDVKFLLNRNGGAGKSNDAKGTENENTSSEEKTEAGLGEKPSKKARLDKQTGSHNVNDAMKATRTLEGKVKAKPPKVPPKLEKSSQKLGPDEKASGTLPHEKNI